MYRFYYLEISFNYYFVSILIIKHNLLHIKCRINSFILSLVWIVVWIVKSKLHVHSINFLIN